MKIKRFLLLLISYNCFEIPCRYLYILLYLWTKRLTHSWHGDHEKIHTVPIRKSSNPIYLVEIRKIRRVSTIFKLQTNIDKLRKCRNGETNGTRCLTLYGKTRGNLWCFITNTLTKILPHCIKTEIISFPGYF